jgi:predicted enzyme related to lactoylglutathione lyase
MCSSIWGLAGAANSNVVQCCGGLCAERVWAWAPCENPGVLYESEMPSWTGKSNWSRFPCPTWTAQRSFYVEQVGFHPDHDYQINESLRFVQLTPPGSACSIALGTGITDAAPGSVQGVQMVVPDAAAARAELVERGVQVSELQEFPWGKFVFFSDPDGNRWSVQEIPPRP